MALGSFKILKYSVISMNVLVILSGIILLTISSSIQQQINATRLSESIGGYSLPAGTILSIIISILCIILGSAGIYASVKERYKFLLAYTASMSFIFIIQLVTGAVAMSARNNPNFEKMVRDRYSGNFATNSTDKSRRDHLQQYFKCCGWNGINDYISMNTFINVPQSCCKTKTKCDVNDLSNLFDMPCRGSIIVYVSHYVEVIGISLIVFALVNMVSIVLTVLYARHVKNNV